MRTLILGLTGVALLAAGGCKTHHTVHIDPIEVKPLTVNVNIRVQEELDRVFDFEQPVAPANPGMQPVPTGGTP